MEALIVSDNESTINILASQLALKHIGVHFARTSKQAIELIKLKNPWIVFAEIKAEEIDAMAIFRVIEKARPEVSVVALSSKFNYSEALTLLRRGFHDYLAAPLDKEHDLIEKSIKRAIAKAVYVVAYLDKHDSLEEERNFIGRELQQLQEDQEAGRYVQLKLFPKNPLILGNMEFSHRIYPSLYLSGDFMDYLYVDDDQSFFYFADVSGHGASSAFITVMLKTLTYRWVQEMRGKAIISPAAYIAFVNQEIRNMQLGKHMTLFAGLLNSHLGTLKYSSAAHFPKPRYRVDGSMKEIEQAGLPVGVFADAVYPEAEMQLSADFALFLCSDGVMEVIEAESLSEKEAILAAIVDGASMDISKIEQQLSLDTREALPDDIGFLVIRQISS